MTQVVWITMSGTNLSLNTARDRVDFCNRGSGENFQTAYGEAVRRQTFERAGATLGVAQWLDRRTTDFIHYAYCPKGPIFKKGAGGIEEVSGTKGLMFLR